MRTSRITDEVIIGELKKLQYAGVNEFNKCLSLTYVLAADAQISNKRNHIDCMQKVIACLIKHLSQHGIMGLLPNIRLTMVSLPAQ
jgi:hypothetical protein